MTQSIRMLAIAFVAAAGTGGAHAAVPTGWASALRGDITVYRPADQDVELRLHAAEPGASIESWFATRSRRAPSDVGALSMGEPNRARPDVRMSAGVGTRSGQKIVVVAMGCQRRDGRMQYAELLLNPDPALVTSMAEPAANIVAEACRNPANTARLAQPVAAPQVAASTPRSMNGLTGASIQEVLYSWDQVFTVGGLQYQEWTYLLLKDGRARRGVPKEPPAAFDAAADERTNPRLWGRWQLVGKDYQVQFEGKWTTPPGQLRRKPGRQGERLEGSFERSASFAFVGGAGAWSNDGLRLSRDGRFRRWSISGAGGTMGFGDEQIATGRITTDKGSASSAGGPNFGGGSSRETGVTDADLMGTYEIDGWSMTLRYDSGKVQSGFFFADDRRRHLWFEGAELMIQEKK